MFLSDKGNDLNDPFLDDIYVYLLMDIHQVRLDRIKLP